MKKILVFVLVTVLTVVPLTACVDRGDPPALEDVYDRLVEVIEEAHHVNFVLFGPGLPVYERDSAEAKLTGQYTDMTGDENIEYVNATYAQYQSISEIKEAVARVYGNVYRTSLFESLFIGYAMAEGDNIVLPARFTEDQGGIYQNRYVEGFVSGQRTYDYASMEIIDGNANHITVAIRSYAHGYPGEWTDGKLDFVYENGNWYLDGPSC